METPGKDLTRLWHEDGLGREALLSLVESAFLEEGYHVVRDDGWHPYDLRIAKGPWLQCDLLTVTEYHDNGAALTRIRLKVRATRFALVLCLATALSFVWFAKALLFLPLLFLLLLFCLSRRWTSTLRKKIEGAGESLGASVSGSKI